MAYGKNTTGHNYRSAEQNHYLAKCKALMGNSLKGNHPSSTKFEKVGGPMGNISNIRGIKYI